MRGLLYRLALKNKNKIRLYNYFDFSKMVCGHADVLLKDMDSYINGSITFTLQLM